MRILLLVVLVIVVAGCILWFALGRSPEVAAGHEPGDRHGGDRFYGDNQAPAGPGAEDERVIGRGVSGTGPGETGR